MDCGIIPRTLAPVKKRKRSFMELVVMLCGTSLARGILFRNFRTSFGNGVGDGKVVVEEVLRVRLLGIDAEELRRRGSFASDGRGAGFGRTGGVEGAAECR